MQQALPADPEDELTDEQYALADAIGQVMEQHPDDTFTPSEMARRVHATTAETANALRWMVANQHAESEGNGAWTRYGYRWASARGAVMPR